MIAALVHAATTTPAPVDESKVQAGFIGLIFFVTMGAVLLALVLSMRRHLGRVDVTKHAREKAAQRPPASPPPGGTV